MRIAVPLSLVLVLSACVAAPSESYDPHLYDANGNVLAAAPPPPPAEPPCREVQTTVTIAGKPQQAYGTACRQQDGSWRFTN